MSSQFRIILILVLLLSAAWVNRAWVLQATPSESVETRLPSPTNNATDDRIWRMSEVDQVPQALNYQQVKDWIGYPETAFQAGIQGDVVLRVLVNENGEYLEHEVKDSFHPLLRIPCEVFTQLMVFTPAAKDGESVKCWVDVAYHFEIPDYGN